MAKRKRMWHSIYYDPNDLRRRIRVRCSPATRTVTLTREESDVLRSKAGSTIGCTNSNCAKRLGEATFGHPVELAEFTLTSVYITDKLDSNRQPKHCIWYKHNDRQSIELNDQNIPREKLLEEINLKKPLVLRPPVLRPNQGPKLTHPQALRHQQTPRRNPVAKGALRRAKKAGLFVPI